MRIGVLSDTRQPTRGVGGHGLGRVAWDVAKELALRGHWVTLYAGEQSEQPPLVKLFMHEDETMRAQVIGHGIHALDAFIDFSHLHDLSNVQDRLPVVNYISDSECQYQPPRAVVCTVADQVDYPDARIVPLGIDVDSYPAWSVHHLHRDYLAFCAKIATHKGVEVALDVHKRQSVPVRFAGEKLMDISLPFWWGELIGRGYHDFVQQARAVLQCSRIGTGGGRIQLEAAAMGTPTLCLDWNGTQEHVAHGISGWIVADSAEMADAVNDCEPLAPLHPGRMREWVKETHDIRVMVDKLEQIVIAAADGEEW